MNCKMAGLMGAAAGGAAGHVAQKKMQEKSEARLVGSHVDLRSTDVFSLRTLAKHAFSMKFNNVRFLS